MKKRSLLFSFALTLASMAQAHEGSSVQDEPILQGKVSSEESNRCWTGDQITGPIWNHEHAQQVCPAVCSNIGGQWTGNWVTVIWGERSVCNCTVC